MTKNDRGSALVNQSFVYGGRDGRLSRKTSSLTFNGTTNETFVSGYTYTPLGDLAPVSYPHCTFATCTGAGAAVPRTVSFATRTHQARATPVIVSLES